MDEFRIFNEARSANQILADFNAGPNTIVPEPGTLSLLGLAGVGLLFRRRS